MKLLIGLTKAILRLFKKEKAPKAINEMKPIEMDKYIMGVDEGDFLDVILRVFVHKEYWKITKKWHKSAKDYHVWLSRDNTLKLFKLGTNTDKMLLYQGNLYTLYQKFYGQKDNN